VRFLGGISTFYERLSAELAAQNFPTAAKYELGLDGKEDFLLWALGVGLPIGAGEVKTQVDGHRQALSRELVKAGGSIQPLPDAAGTWDVRVLPNFNVKSHMQATLTTMLKHATETSSSSWHSEYANTHRSENADLQSLLKMKVQSYSKISDEGSRAFIHEVSTHGWVPPIAPKLNDWLTSLFEQQNYKNSLERLEKSPVEQKHFFIWIGDASPRDLFMAAKFHPEKPPEDPPNIPTHLTHFWVGLGIFPNKQIMAWRFEHDTGWSLTSADYIDSRF
jgi:hypothetical protein